MTPQETKDTETLRTAIDKAKIVAFDAIIRFTKMTTSEMSHTGYKTVNDALLVTIYNAQKTIKKLTTEYLTKYPD